MKNTYLLENIMFFLCLRWIAFGFILNFNIEIITHPSVFFAFVHVDNLFALYFRNANILIPFLAPESIQMNTNDHHQDTKCNPNFSLFVGSINLVFGIKYRFLKFKTLLSFRMGVLILFLLWLFLGVLGCSLGELNQAIERSFTVSAIFLFFEKMVFVLKKFKFLEKFGLLKFLFLAELFDIGPVFEFVLSLFIEFVKIPLFIFFLESEVRIEIGGVRDFRHGEVGIFVGLERDGLIPAEDVQFVKGKLIAHIILYKLTNNIVLIVRIDNGEEYKVLHYGKSIH